MGIESRYVHSLVIKRMAASVDVDEYGQPVSAETTVATVPGLVQPRSAREVALANQAGAVIGSHVGYIAPLAGLATDCWIELAAPSDMAGRYDVVTLADAAGLGHHLELDLRRVA